MYAWIDFYFIKMLLMARYTPLYNQHCGVQIISLMQIKHQDMVEQE